LDFIEKIVILDRQNAPDHEFMTRSRRRHLSRRLTLGQYYPSQSNIHQLDPRIKLPASMIIMALLMWIESWAVLAFWTVVLAAVVQRTQVPSRLFARNLRAFLWLFAITILLQALSPNFYGEAPNFNYHDSSPQWRVWGISVSWTGLISGIKYAWRLVLLILVAGILSFTTVPTDLTDGVERLLKPLQRWRVPVHELAFMTTLALRFVPTIIDEAERIQKAQMSRGANFSGPLVKRIQALVPLLVPLFVATFHRADELAMAMEARCYRGSEGRVSFREMRFQKRDLWVVANLLICIVITMAFERY
jgi:energy-coupling factor transport system permease protein